MRNTQPQAVVIMRSDGDWDIICAFPEGINPEVREAVRVVIGLHYYDAVLQDLDIVDIDAWSVS